MKKIKAPSLNKAIVIELLNEMPYDFHGCHATGRTIHVCGFSWDEYYDQENDELFYGNR